MICSVSLLLSCSNTNTGLRLLLVPFGLSPFSLWGILGWKTQVLKQTCHLLSSIIHFNVPVVTFFTFKNIWLHTLVLPSTRAVFYSRPLRTSKSSCGFGLLPKGIWNTLWGVLLIHMCFPTWQNPSFIKQAVFRCECANRFSSHSAKTLIKILKVDLKEVLLQSAAIIHLQKGILLSDTSSTKYQISTPF